MLSTKDSDNEVRRFVVATVADDDKDLIREIGITFDEYLNCLSATRRRRRRTVDSTIATSYVACDTCDMPRIILSADFKQKWHCILSEYLDYSTAAIDVSTTLTSAVHESDAAVTHS